jgi:hypothetical protein
MLAVYAVILFAVGALVFVGGALLWIYSESLQFREPRTIICPETLRPAEVTVDGAYAARTSFSGHEQFRLRACSRWPERRSCDQACAGQVPLVGDARQLTRYAAFGLSPQHLRINSPVAMSLSLYTRLAPELERKRKCA